MEMKNWKQEMESEKNMSRGEVRRFLKIIDKSGIPSIEEYAGDKNREDAQDEYWDKYGDTIRAAKDEATVEQE